LLGDHQDACFALDGRRLPPLTLFVIGRFAERYERPGLFARVRGKRWKELRRTMRAAAPLAPLPPPATG